MFEYVALIWNQKDSKQSDYANLLTARLRTDSPTWQFGPHLNGFCVCWRGGHGRAFRARRLTNNAGVVLGALFKRRDDPAALSSLDTIDVTETHAIMESRGQRLIEKYWGAYVAIMREATGQRAWVLRSPANSPPCQYLVTRGVRVLFSQADIGRVLGLRFSINWRNVAAYCSYNRRPWGETGLNEVSELELGECLYIDEDRSSKSFYWNPCTFARSDPIDDPSTAAALARDVTRCCVSAWASQHESILLRLSGGVDSSIVLACLRDAPNRPRVTGIHYYHSSGAYGDERKYARIVAQHVGCELVEMERGRDFRIESLFIGKKTAAPLAFGHPEYERLQAQLAAQRQATATFCGTWGDLVFHLSPGIPAGAEYVQRHGLRLGLCDVLLDAAHLDAISIWKAAGYAIRYGLLDRPKVNWDPSSPVRRRLLAADRLVHPRALDELDGVVERLTHPWLHDVANVGLGKLWLIHTLPFDDYWRNPYAEHSDPEAIPPFISEPIIELCLRIPTYLHIANGWDRAVARAAFAKDLPPEIIQRVSKGSPDAWTRSLIDDNKGVIREYLLGGLLAQQGVLDKRQIEAALPGRVTTSNCPVGVIIEHLTTEAWARGWMDAQQSAAVA